MTDLSLLFSSLVYVSRFVIKTTPIPAQIINIEVELPMKRFVNFPKIVSSRNEPKQKVKFTINIPKIAYALAKSNPIILCFMLSVVGSRFGRHSLAGNVCIDVKHDINFY